MIAALLEELRTRGIELRANGSALRVFGPRDAYSSALRGRIAALKPEILEHLRREEETAAASYDREEHVWAARFVACFAVARGYSAELASIAAQVVAKAPARAPFRVDRDVIVISMGAGCEVWIHRVPQSWLAAADLD